MPAKLRKTRAALLGAQFGARLAVAGAALLFATGGTAIKLISPAISAWQIAGARAALAALLLWLAFPQWRALQNRRAWLVAVPYAATMVFFVLANRFTTAAAAIFLQSTATLYILLGAPRLLNEARRKSDWPIVGVIAAGAALLFWGSGAGEAVRPELSPRPMAGALIGAAGGLSWALTLMGLRWLGRANSSAPAAASADAGAAIIAGNILTLVVCAPFALHAAALPSTRDALVLAYLGAVQVGLAYVLMVRGVAKLRALEVALLLLMESALSAALAWGVHGEALRAPALAGCAAIACGVGADALRARRRRGGW